MTSSTRSMDTYISLLTCSERMMLPLTGIVTSIFCLSFSTLMVTMISVSGVKYLSNFPSLSVTALRRPSVTSMFLPLIVKRISSTPLSINSHPGILKELFSASRLYESIIPYRGAHYKKLYKNFLFFHNKLL